MMSDNRSRNGGRMLVWIMVLVVCGSTVRALGQGQKSDYERSSSYNERTRNRVFRDSVEPHWFDDDRFFWYRIRVGTNAHEYILVDVENKKRSPAFDHDVLAEELSAVTGSKVDPSKIAFSNLEFDRSDVCRFRFRNRSWTFQLPRGPLAESATKFAENLRKGLSPENQIVRSRDGGERTDIKFDNRLDRELEYFWVMPDGGLRSYGKVPAGQVAGISTYEGHAWVLQDKSGDSIAAFVASSTEELAVIDKHTVVPRRERPRRTWRGRGASRSPDGRYEVSLRDHNVFLVNLSKGQRQQLTRDGVEKDSYGGRVWWSPDSKHFVVMKTVPGQGRTIPIVESSPRDSIHSSLITLPYAKPGDQIDHPRPVLFSEDSDWRQRDVNDELFPNPYSIRDLQWRPDSHSFSFIYNERGHQRLSLIDVDASTLLASALVEEAPETFVCYSSKTFLRRLEDRDELIWMSERSGWNHLYLIDSKSGEIKRPLTLGEWVVREVVEVDEDARHMLLKVSGLDAGQDPYHIHLVRVDLDTAEMVRLTGGDGDHRWTFSPSGKYLIDTYSRVDLPPVNVLRDAGTGQEICELERAETSELLASGWQPPERFVAKGRDGETDIYGVIIRPTNFDPEKRYPVLENIYAGPHSSFVPKRFGMHTGLYAMAELGFIVVKIDGMGTSNRSKAFHDVCWKNLGDSGFPDRIAWMKAAAKERPEMDLARVGIWGGSAGGQSAMRALIAHGDFYHAAVADCGCHDNRVDKIWWNEQWMGWPIGPHYSEQSNATQAHLLKGDLMLIWGELDRNVDPASTMQVIDALVKADKDFEQLIVPGTGHGAAGHPYAKRRQSDFFIRKLWHREPRTE